MVDNFKLYMDIDITKSSSQEEDENRYSNMVFSGVASDATKDAEGEILDPKGFIYDRFLKSGLINLDHLPSRSPINKSRFWIGEPIEAYVKDGKFFVKGKLWEKSPEARAFWDKCVEMLESGSTRKPGMSVEGKALERDPQNPGHITKALITNVALTMTPVNPSTFVDIQKSKKSMSYDDNVLFEWKNEDGDICVIDKDFNCKLKKSIDSIENFWIICNSFQKGQISNKIFDDYVRKVGKIIL